MMGNDHNTGTTLTRYVVPEPRVPITIRTATEDDIPAIDALHKKHNRMMGFLTMQALRSYVSGGHVIVAEGGEERESGSRGAGERSLGDGGSSSRHSSTPALPHSRSSCRLLGYCIGRDRYFKHDDIGIIYHLNVTPEAQRMCVGASLVKAMFERAAYGCKLYSCWCAQDLDAGYFWESLGFVPIAFRTGGTGAGEGDERIHIFWQCRVRREDGEGSPTPFWYPSETTGGQIRANRIVLPIPPGTHWKDAKPVILPGMAEERAEAAALMEAEKQEARATKKEKKSTKKKKMGASGAGEAKVERPTLRPRESASGGLWFCPPPAGTDKANAAAAKLKADAEEQAEKEEREGTKPAKATKKKKTEDHGRAARATRNAPEFVAAAREFRDRWMERVAEEPALLDRAGKYDVTRSLEDDEGMNMEPVRRMVGGNENTRKRKDVNTLGDDDDRRLLEAA